jgi:dolichyl-phosphate-mannose--protein O-mannosyl transferase
MKIEWGLLVFIIIVYLFVVGTDLSSVLFLFGAILTYLIIKILNSKFEKSKCFKNMVINDIVIYILMSFSWVGLFVYILILMVILIFDLIKCKIKRKEIQ